MSEIYFIRHGQASFGSENYDRLSEKGVLQAKILGRHLAALEKNFNAVCFGEMDRQEKTARGVIEAYQGKKMFIPEPVVDTAFNEYDSALVWDTQVNMMLEDEPGLLDALKKDHTNKKAFQKVFSRVVERWISGEFDLPGVIRWKDFTQRVVIGIKNIMKTWKTSKRIAVFTSGGPICAAVQMALDLSDKKTIDLSWQVMNASITRIKYNSRQINLSGFNDITHLELEGDKTLLTYR